ncbi:MAG: hypothetical protein MK197_00805 [Candidatus Poseidoniaceae archaeon]|nr:hypothetical protein [Candidatus Poseidoniaceae archaeon]
MSDKDDFSFSISKPSLLNLVSFVFTISTLLILLTTVSSNSWMTASDDGDDYLFGLSELEESEKYTSFSRDYDSREWIMFDGEEADSAGTVALIFLWIAILAVISSLVLLCLNNFGDYRSNYAMTVAFIGGGLAIIGAIVWWIMFPEVNELEEDGLGLGSAFYLTIIAGLLSVGSGFSLLKSPETDDPIWMPVRRTFSEMKNSDQGNLDLISLGLVLGAVLVLFVSMFTTSWMTGSEDDAGFGFGLYGVEYSFEEFTFTGDYSDPDAGEEVGDAMSAGTTGAIFLWIAALVAIASLVLMCLNNIGVYTSKYGMIAAFASGGLAILGTIIWLIMFSTPSFFDEIDLSPGISFYLAIIGGLSCIGAGACNLMSDRKQRV